MIAVFSGRAVTGTRRPTAAPSTRAARQSGTWRRFVHSALARDLELTRTNVSNHLACLRGCGIVVAEPEGRQTRYEIADPHLAAALNALVDVTLAVDESIPCLDPSCTVAGCCDGADEAR